MPEEPPPENPVFPSGYVPFSVTSDGYANAFQTFSGPETSVAVPLAELPDGNAVQGPSTNVLFENSFFSQASPEYHVHAKLRTSGTGNTTSDRGCYLYLIAIDRAELTGWSEGGSDNGGPITLASPSNAIQLGFVSMPEKGVSYQAGPFSVAQAFGGIPPDQFAIVLENRTGAALSSTEDDLKVSIQAYRVLYLDVLEWLAAGDSGSGGGGGESA